MRRMIFVLTCLIMVAVSIPVAATPVQAAPDLSLGDMVAVINTLGIGLAVRDAPAGDIVTRKYDGTSGSVIGGPEAAVLPSDGRTYTWWKIRWGDDGTEGWSADSFPEPGGEDYLQKQTKPVSTKFSVGQRVRVVNMGMYNYRVRTGPPALYMTDTFKHEGDTGTITDLSEDSATYYGVPDVAAGAAPLYKGPANDYFYHFWKIQWDDGQIGWSAEGAMDGDYLIAISDAPAVAYISITPESSTILNGYSQSYAVEAFDQSGNSLGDVTSGSVIWSYGDEPGAIAATYGNKQYAVRAGAGTVAAYYAGKYDTARLNVEEHSLPYIHGWAYDDSDDSPTWPDWETGLPNCSVYLDGVLVTSTDENGHFIVPNLSPRVYEIRMQPPPGYYPWEDFWTVREFDLTDVTGGRLTWWRFRVQTFSTFEFYPIGNQVSGVPFPVMIWVRDRLGNLDTSYSGEAYIVVEPADAGELPPDYHWPWFTLLEPASFDEHGNALIRFANGVWDGVMAIEHYDRSVPLILWAYDTGDSTHGPFGSSGAFTVSLSEQRFQAPYKYSSEYGWHESFLVGDADHVAKVDSYTGTGGIQARAISGLGGSGQALARFQLGDSWVSDRTERTNIAARLNIDDGMIAWSQVSIFGISGQVFCGITFEVLLTVYDATESREVFREKLSVYDRPPQWRIISLPDADAIRYEDTEYVIQGLLDLEKDHYYTWDLTAQVYTWVISVGPVAYAVANGIASIELADVVIGPSIPAPQPAPITSEFLHALLASPADILVIDPEGRRTGFDSMMQEEVNEIPEAWYSGQGVSPQLVELPDLIPGVYRFLVSGTDIGVYKLSVLRGDLADEDTLELATFQSADIPTSTSQLHEYIIDWEALAQGEKGVTVRVDSDGDGEFEDTFISDGEITHDEFMLQTATTIDFDPDTLNLKSKGEFVTVYIELPTGYDVGQIDISSISLNGTVPVLAKPTEIGDYNDNGIPDLMVKFDRRATQALLEVGESVGITVTGMVDGMQFTGTDTIRVIGP